MKITQETIYHCLSSLRFKLLRYLPFTPHHHHHHHQPPSHLDNYLKHIQIVYVLDNFEYIILHIIYIYD